MVEWLLLTDERNFVGAKKNTGVNADKDNTWQGNEIVAEPGCTYRVRLVAHNNNPRGMDAVAEDVKIRFRIQDMVKVEGSDTSIEDFDDSDGYYAVAVYGDITSSNSVPDLYSDGVKFVSHRPFHLVYIPGTAEIENNGIGSRRNDVDGTTGCPLSDDIVKDGILIGYDKLDGRIPGCYQYTSYSIIIVMPVFD